MPPPRTGWYSTAVPQTHLTRLEWCAFVARRARILAGLVLGFLATATTPVLAVALPPAPQEIAARATPGALPTPLPSDHGSLVVRIDGDSVVFRDVPAGSWFAPSVFRLAGRGILSGYRDGTGRATGAFGPADPVSYAELAKLALLGAGKVVGGFAGTPAERADPERQLAAYTELAQALRLFVYQPGLDMRQPVPRGVAVRTILEAAGVSLDPPSDFVAFADLPATHPDAQAIETAVRLGLLTGRPDPTDGTRTIVRPDAPATRAEVTAILSRLLDLVR